MVEARKSPTWQVSTKQRTRARTLRRDLIDAERIIWNAVRAHRLAGASFRRQTPIGPYIVDFVCHDANLIIELDGGQHFEAEQMKRDVRRSAFLSSKGYRVLRFNNYDVMTNRQGVLETIARAVMHTPSPPLPQRKGVDARLRRAMRGREQTESVSLPVPPSRGAEQ